MERVRFAPSPTGPLHIGGLRTALINYIYARKNNGIFIVRVEDTDLARKVEGSEKYIFDSLKWCGIEADESAVNGGEFGPYRQSERKDIYKKYINVLIEKGLAYYAYDSAEDLMDARKEAESKGDAFKYGANNRSLFSNSLTCSDKENNKLLALGTYVVRLKVDGTNDVVCQDMVRGEINVNEKELEDKILMKADGMPTYHFANVVDDHLMKITTVIRGEEWLPSLPIHQLLYQAFEWDAPKFMHLPLILNPGGKGKLSKRDGDKHGYPVFPLPWRDSKGYIDFGFLPEAHINYIAQLGWSVGDQEIMSLEEMIAQFEVDNIQKGGARFDFDKAKWVNQQHLGKIGAGELMSRFHSCFEEAIKALGDRTIDAVEMIYDRLITLEDITNELACFYTHPKQYNEKSLKRLEKVDGMQIASLLKANVSTSGVDRLKEEIVKMADEYEISMGGFMQVLRVCVVGALSGPDLVPLCQIIGKDVTLERINRFLEHIKS